MSGLRIDGKIEGLVPALVRGFGSSWLGWLGTLLDVHVIDVQNGSQGEIFNRLRTLRRAMVFGKGENITSEVKNK